MKPKRRSPLQGLDEVAVELVYSEQPLHRPEPEADPLVVLNGLDNDDKHRLMHPVFVYTDLDEGLELIEIVVGSRVVGARSSWRPGRPLEDGMPIATSRAGTRSRCWAARSPHELTRPLGGACDEQEHSGGVLLSGQPVRRSAGAWLSRTPNGRSAGGDSVYPRGPGE